MTTTYGGRFSCCAPFAVPVEPVDVMLVTPAAVADMSAGQAASVVPAPAAVVPAPAPAAVVPA